MRRILIGTTFLMSIAIPARAGLHRWTPVGPEGGRATQVLPDPTSQDVVWALVDSRPFRSSDGGATWTERSAGLPFPAFGPTEQLAIDAAQPATLLAAASGAEVYRTADAGVTWTRVLGSVALSSQVTLHTDPFAPGTFYVAPSSAGLRVLRSTDHGATWTSIGTAPAPGSDVEDFALDPSTAGRWYAVLFGTGTNRLVVSNDAGTTWLQRGGGLPTQYRDLVVTATSPPTLWVYSTANGLYRSTDGGTTFSQSGLGRTDVRIIAVDPAAPQTVYGVKADSFPKRFFRSTNSGTTWTAIDLHAARLPTASLASLAVDPFDAAHLWAGTYDDGVLASVDHGAHWTTASTGLPRNRPVCTLAVAPGGATLHAVSAGSLWTSRDGGTSWTANAPEVTAGPPFATVDGVAIDPTDSGVVYAASPSGVFRSGDGGASWAASGSGLPPSGARAVAVDPLTPLTLYATTATGVYRSLDGGASWALRGPGDFSSLIVDPTLPSTIYFDGGTAVSRDGGATSAPPGMFDPYVNQPGVIHLVATVAPAPTAPGKVYAGLDATVFDGDRNFWFYSWLTVSADRLASVGSLSTTIPPSALFVAPSDDLSLYVGRAGGALHSRDGGTTLEPFQAGLRGDPCTFAGGAAGDPLYAGTTGSDGTRPFFGVYAIEEPSCSADPDCDDGAECTTDRCTAGRCSHEALANGTACGTPDEECVAAGRCFQGSCVSYQGCSDGDSCTTDRCHLPGVCSHEAIPGCCSVAADCDDGNPCTSHTCTASQCVSTLDLASCDDRRVTTASIRIVSRSGGSKVTFETSDPTIVVPAFGGADDPSLVGATVEFFPAGAAASAWTLPPGLGRPGWKVGATAGLAYLFVDPVGSAIPSPVRRLTLRARPQLRLTAAPSADPLGGATPTQLGVRVTFGDSRICALFSGTSIRKSGPGLFVARGTMLPFGSCEAASLAGTP